MLLAINLLANPSKKGVNPLNCYVLHKQYLV